jgi:predicted membrane channel-forming protein YqfA (hemolysin III family)
MNEFMTPETLATFAGLVAAVAVIVQFTKSLVKKQFDDYAVRIYAFFVALLLTSVFAPSGYDIKGIVLTVINAILITLAAVGGYEVIADPKAEKIKQ